MREFWRKRLPALALAALMLAGSAIPAAAVKSSKDGPEEPASHEDHTPKPGWGVSNDMHWQVCSQGGEVLAGTEAPHAYGEVIEDTPATCTRTGVGHRICSVCDFRENNVEIPVKPHTLGAYEHDAANHWQTCSECRQRINTAAHTFSAPVISQQPTASAPGAGIQTCTVCGYDMAVVIPATGHTAASGWQYDAKQHWHPCALHPDNAEDRLNVGNHTMTWSHNASEHWQVCSVCGYTGTRAAHVDGNQDGKCDSCGYELPNAAKYTVTFINAGATFGTQKNLVKNAKPSNPGTPTKSAGNCTYKFKGWTTSNPGSTAVYTGQTVLSSAQVAATAVTGNVTYYAVYTVSAVKQNVTLNLSGTDAVTVGTDARNKINSAFKSIAGRDFVSVTFSSVGTTSYGTLFANSSRTSLTGQTYSYSGGSYPVTDLYFVPSGTRGTYTVTYSANDGYTTVQGTLSITTSASATTKISYSVRPGERVELDRSDFNSVYQSTYSETVRYIRFTSVSSFSSSDGTFYYNYGGSSQREFSRSDLRDYDFYYSSDSYGSYPIRDISFLASSDASRRTITLDFRAYYASNRYVDGTLEIQISGTNSTVTYQVQANERVEMNRSDFYRVFDDAYSNYELRYVRFLSGGSYTESDGKFYFDYDEKDERSFTKNSLTNYLFYYDNTKYGDYALNDLSFFASDSFDGSATVNFRAYYDDSRYVDGTLTLKARETTRRGDIRYSSAGGANVQFNPNDFARFLNRTYSGAPLQSVKLNGVPETGTLYYNYYGVSTYGASSLRLTSSNCGSQLLYFSPSGINQYSLGELTYVPSGSNYCVTIPFTAYSTNNRSVQGSVLISVNNVTVQDVYGPTPMNTSVSFPADSIYNAVAASASNAQLYSIQLLELPASSKGTIYVGTGSTKATTSGRYTYSANSGNGRIRDLRFAPATGFTGSVEIPYVAYSSTDRAIASGRLCLGVVKGLKSYRDVNSSTWCYKYVAELSDEKVIDGYPDGYFRPDKTVTYGQALKLIMLAADYSVQNPTGKHPFSGYLTRAAKDGLVSGVKESDLDRPISRLAVAQITAKAMHLSLSNLSSVKPFTDTSDVYVQALNAAGIVEGYFSNGTSTFKPANTMTRGQISAIVWRMDRAQ